MKLYQIILKMIILVERSRMVQEHNRILKLDKINNKLIIIVMKRWIQPLSKE